MPSKSLAVIVVLLASVGPAVMAGNIGPTWAEDVTVQATPNPDGSGLVTNVWATPSTSDEFGLSYSYNRYDGAYSSIGVLLEYQGPGAATIDITDAFLSYGFSGSVPLYVSVFAGSPEPFVPDVGDTLTTFQFSIPIGIDSASPLLLNNAVDVSGPVAFLLSTGLSPDYDIYDGVSSYITLSVVPEPSGVAMLPVGIGFAILLYASWRMKKRPGSIRDDSAEAWSGPVA
jgi:hypothetical protein